MKAKELAKFKKILQGKRETLLKNAQQTLETDMTLDTADLPDEMDLASSEYLQSFQFRLRGRERTFLSKIDSSEYRFEYIMLRKPKNIEHSWIAAVSGHWNPFIALPNTQVHPKAVPLFIKNSNYHTKIMTVG